MSDKKRYGVTLYVDTYAEDDDEARKVAWELREKVNRENRVRGYEIECNPWATMEYRKVETKDGN